MARYTGPPSGRTPMNNMAPAMRARQSITQPGSATSVTKDYEEFASLQLDKPLEGELKTSEEMKRHLFDDHFEGRPIERAMHLLAVGEEVQKLSVIRQLLQLIQADEQGCMQRVFPKIQQALNTASTEFHIETAKAFSAILERKAISNHAFVQTFLPSILYHIDNRDQVVSNAWLDTLLDVSEVLPVDVIKHEILHVAVNKGQISQSVWHRVAACKLLGKMCTRFDQHTVKKDILPVVHSLCQDVNETVRACICSQLHRVAKGLPSEMIKPALIPILVELGRDETVQVRVEATETIVHMIPFLSQEVLKITIIPLVKKICEQAVLAMDDTLIMVARQFGSLCTGLENCLSPGEKLWMVTYYHNMSHLGIPSYGAKKDVYFTSHNMDRINARYIECRQLCAYNFPAMSKFCSSSPELLEKLYPSFCDFATDPYYMVRKTVGAGIHEVARILGSNNRIVKNQVMTLLWDNMEEVLMGVVPHLGRTIDLLIASGVLGHEQDGATVELGRGLLQCDKTIRDKTHNWRLHADFIAQLESIVRCLPSDYIYTHFVSLMFDKMHRARPLPCRLAAVRTLLVFLRHNLKSNQRQEIRARIQAEFCMSSSCYKRMLFLRLCVVARDVFSRAYFKEHFFYLLLSRAEDKVANNRLLLARQLPYLKAMIIMPSERKYLQTLETCIRNMAATEKDKDVTAELRLSVARLDKTETLSESSNMPTLDDIEDKKKYDEELKLLNMIPRGGAGATDGRRAPVKPPERQTYATATATPARGANPSGPRDAGSTASTPTPRSAPPSAASHNPSASVSHISTTPSMMRQYGPPTPQASGNLVRKPMPNFPDASSQASSQSMAQSFTTNATNMYPLRTSLALLDVASSPHRNCTCFSQKFRSDYFRNLNLRALIDTGMEHGSEVGGGRATGGVVAGASSSSSSSTPRHKSDFATAKSPRGSCKYSMEISWLNLETDLKNELFTLAKGGKVHHGDRNLKEKNIFLTDFRSFNESTLGKFINDERDYKETIYNVRGDSNHYGARANNFFEERINFFERKIKLEDSKAMAIAAAAAAAAAASASVDCSCFELTTNNNNNNNINRLKHAESNENKKFSYFSKSFEQDFYRDAGVKANEVMARRASGIPVSSPVIAAKATAATTTTTTAAAATTTTTATVTTTAAAAAATCATPSSAAASKRRTWFGRENANGISLDALVKFAAESGERASQRKKSETLPLRESISLEKIGIGPRSKSFILPSTLIYSDKHRVANHQSTKLVFDKGIGDLLRTDGGLAIESLDKANGENDSTTAKNNSRNSSSSSRNGGAGRKVTRDGDGTRFGFRQKSPKGGEAKAILKTKIPIGRGSNNSSPNSSRSSSPSFPSKGEAEAKAAAAAAPKKIPVVASRKSMLVQGATAKGDARVNRRSLDPSKLSMVAPKVKTYAKKADGGEGKSEAADGEAANSGTCSKLPVRRPRPPDK